MKYLNSDLFCRQFTGQDILLIGIMRLGPKVIEIPLMSLIPGKSASKGIKMKLKSHHLKAIIMIIKIIGFIMIN